MITKTPLCWPNNLPRTAPQNRTAARFELRTIDQATREVMREINLLNVRNNYYRDESLIISSNLRLRKDGLPESNQAEPLDPGIAVYFTLRFARNGKWHERPCVLSCDKFKKAALNLRAIGKDINAQRARERYGCTSIEQAFRGYVAIPEKCGVQPWWAVLGIASTAPKQIIHDKYKLLAKQRHPDGGGTAEAFEALRRAYEEAMAAGTPEKII